MWLLFLLIHLVGLVGYNLVLRKSLVAKVDKWVLATVMQTAIAIPIIPVLFFKHPDISAYDSRTIFQICITVILVVLLHLTNVQALQSLEAGVYSILYNLRIIFTTILGILFLGEKIIPLQILGGLFIFLAVLTVKQKGKKQVTGRGIEWGLAAAVVISFLNLFEKKLINEVGYLDYAAAVMVVAAIVMWIVLLTQGKRIKLQYFREPKTINLMVLRAMSAYGFTLAFNAGGVLSVSSYISSLSVIVIVLLGAWLLGERDYMERKLTATALAVLGLTVILIANLMK
jgi:drug/metabolite transporter (DMT)-like permease